MDIASKRELEARAARHRALGDAHRLAITDALAASDRTPGELAALLGLDSNLLGFHLRALEEAGLIRRRTSSGDRRRRYVRLVPEAIAALGATAPRRSPPRRPLFVCTANAARSPFAAALWHRRTGGQAASAGSRPAERVHPLAVEVAAAHGLDLRDRRPQGYAALDARPDLVVTVCDRAREDGPPFDVEALHWSVPDPDGGDRAAFEAAFADIAARLERLLGTAS